MKTIYILLIITITCVSCQRQQVENIKFKKLAIDFDKHNAQSLDLINSIDSIRIVPLETDSTFIIGGIKNLRYDAPYLFIEDPLSQCLYVYDVNGNGISKIANNGRGAGEFISITDFTILNNNTIVIMDNMGGKIIFYNLHGDFLREINIEDPHMDITCISVIDNDYLTLFTDYRDTISCVSILDITNGKIKRIPFNLPPYAQNSQLSLNRTFSKYKDSVLFKTVFDYNVFQITPDSIIPRYQFDFKRYNIPLTSFDGEIETYIAYARRNDYISNLDDLLENNKYIYCNFFKGGNAYDLYYNKQQQQPYIFNTTTLPDEFKSLYSVPKYAKDNYFIFTLADEDCLHTLLKFHQASMNHIKLIYTPLTSQKNLENNNPHLVFIYTQ